MMHPPLVAFDSITPDELNRCLVAWGHKMGPLNRPNFGRARFYGLRHDGELVGVAAVDQMIPAETCGLRRGEAFELTRICASRRDLCRVVLRIAREFVFPSIAQAWRTPWAFSYQDAALHSGALYRHDGWVRLGKTHSGPERRGAGGTRPGRDKIVWGWHADEAARAKRRAA